MKQLNLPFRLGMDYEEFEFDVEILPDRVQGYDSYIYLGEFNNFLNYMIDKIELLFKIDVLEAIIIALPLNEPEDVAAQLANLLGSAQIMDEQEYKLYKFDFRHYVSWHYWSDNTTHLIIAKETICLKICRTLLWD